AAQMSKTYDLSRRVFPLAFCLLFPIVISRSPGAELLPPGFRPLPLGVHALVGGKVVIKPGDVIESGTIVIRDGFIKAVGKDVAVPDDARVWEMKGTIIYAGFIDSYLPLGSSNPPLNTSESEQINAS